MEIGYLTCPATRSTSDDRRADAFEHDLQFKAIARPLEELGHSLHEIDWRSPVETFARFALVLIGTPWDYHEDEPGFLAQIARIEDSGTLVANPGDLVRWNANKRYLADLEGAGAAVIPTLWVERADSQTIRSAFEHFGCERIVAKRQVGLGAIGQSIHEKARLDPDWHSPDPMMIQPFLAQVASEGEMSFIFIDGAFSHALVKSPQQGDYRVQSIYGGTEEIYRPEKREIAAARRIIEMVPFDTPLYARIDMLRGADGALMVMEAEMIEPYLYPEQGPRLGRMLADAIEERINRS